MSAKANIQYFKHMCPCCKTTLEASYLQRDKDHWPQILLIDYEYPTDETCPHCKEEISSFTLERKIFEISQGVNE